MALQAAALAVIAASTGFTGWAIGTILLGAGTAMFYPTLLAVIGDIAHPLWRGRTVGIYRVWRDLGYAVGAIIADLLGLHAAVWTAAAASAATALLVAFRMYETHPRRPGQTRERDISLP
ncbi:MFS family permease [Amycolatopsis magusensis]|uniref:MFS family permease n=2 Tax=Amycolatopsis magusensis TaxID=882444 RepID=A0ABS4PY09_9PSEU|nr:MFS family permease [Amycolatopsis magusensis]